MDSNGNVIPPSQVVQGANQPPTASFTFSPSSPTTSDTISFDASSSDDSDGNIQSYSWDFGDGTTATGQTASHSYSSNGTFTVELTVTDNDGATSTTTQTVTVGGGSFSVTASGGSASPGGQATVSVQADNTGSITISNIPSNWTVQSSTNDGAFLRPDGPNGNQISSQGSVLWVWNNDQSTVNVDVTLGVPSGTMTGDVTLSVEAENSAGATGIDTATVSVQNCPFDPVVCTFDPNGNIDTGELQQAINDFVNQNISTGDLQAVINAFIQNQAP